MLAAALTATRDDGDVDLSLTVTNDGDDAVTLSFRDAQRADFVAEPLDDAGAATDGDGGDRDPDGDGGDRDPDGGGWRYSDGRMFAMATGSERLAPGDSVTYAATWPDAPPGEYRIEGWVVAEDATASATTTVDVT